jgi:uncharacterized MAPEG superfamily protein
LLLFAFLCVILCVILPWLAWTSTSKQKEGSKKERRKEDTTTTQSQRSLETSTSSPPLTRIRTPPNARRERERQVNEQEVQGAAVRDGRLLRGRMALPSRIRTPTHGASSARMTVWSIVISSAVIYCLTAVCHAASTRSTTAARPGRFVRASSILLAPLRRRTATATTRKTSPLVAGFTSSRPGAFYLPSICKQAAHRVELFFKDQFKPGAVNPPGVIFVPIGALRR